MAKTYRISGKHWDWKRGVKVVRTGNVTITVDFETIARTLGERALFNRTRKATALHGAIVVTATNVETDEHGPAA